MERNSQKIFGVLSFTTNSKAVEVPVFVRDATVFVEPSGCLDRLSSDLRGKKTQLTGGSRKYDKTAIVKASICRKIFYCNSSK